MVEVRFFNPIDSLGNFELIFFDVNSIIFPTKNVESSKLSKLFICLNIFFRKRTNDRLIGRLFCLLRFDKNRDCVRARSGRKRWRDGNLKIPSPIISREKGPYLVKLFCWILNYVQKSVLLRYMMQERERERERDSSPRNSSTRVRS